MKIQRDNVLSRTDTVTAGDLAVAVVLKGAQSSSLVITGTVTSTPATAATSAVTRVAASATNVTLLAANVNRRGAMIANHSTVATLYIKLGATASITAGSESFTAILAPNNSSDVGGYYEVPFGYTGIIDGIWGAADAAGEALMTEITP